LSLYTLIKPPRPKGGEVLQQIYPPLRGGAMIYFVVKGVYHIVDFFIEYWYT
jgi:hypothetical protein